MKAPVVAVSAALAVAALASPQDPAKRALSDPALPATRVETAVALPPIPTTDALSPGDGLVTVSIVDKRGAKDEDKPKAPAKKTKKVKVKEKKKEEKEEKEEK